MDNVKPGYTRVLKSDGSFVVRKNQPAPSLSIGDQIKVYRAGPMATFLNPFMFSMTIESIDNGVYHGKSANGDNHAVWPSPLMKIVKTDERDV